MSPKFAFVTFITVIRAPLVLLFAAGAIGWHFAPDALPYFAALNLAILAIASITDMFDGMLARKWHVTSKFGALADPMTDKVFYLAVFPTLTTILALRVANGGASALHVIMMLVFTIAYLLRDQWVSLLRALAAGHSNADMRANWAGKLRTALSFPIGCALYAHIAWNWSWLSENVMLGLEIFGLIINFVSIHSYTKRYGDALRSALRPNA